MTSSEPSRIHQRRRDQQQEGGQGEGEHLHEVSGHGSSPFRRKPHHLSGATGRRLSLQRLPFFFQRSGDPDPLAPTSYAREWQKMRQTALPGERGHGRAEMSPAGDGGVRES